MRSSRLGRLVLGLCLATLLLAMTACGEDEVAGPGDGGTLEGTTWVLDRASVQHLAPDAPTDARVDLTFEGDAVSGSSGCNRYGGSVEVDGSSVAFRDLFGTQMACAQTLMDLESAYLAALGAVDEQHVNGVELVLTGADVRLVYEAEAEQEPAALVGTTWQLDSLATGTDAVSSPVAGPTSSSNSTTTGPPRVPVGATRSTPATRPRTTRSGSIRSRARRWRAIPSQRAGGRVLRRARAGRHVHDRGRRPHAERP